MSFVTKRIKYIKMFGTKMHRLPMTRYTPAPSYTSAPSSLSKPEFHISFYLQGSTMMANQREELWANKRVFFVTPQCISNDLGRGICPAQDVKCVVIDEAHKATGNHAYCQVITKNGFFHIIVCENSLVSDL